MNCRWSTEHLHRSSLRLYNLDSSFLKLLPPLTVEGLRARIGEILEASQALVRALTQLLTILDKVSHIQKGEDRSLEIIVGEDLSTSTCSKWLSSSFSTSSKLSFMSLEMTEEVFVLWLFSLKTSIEDGQLRKEGLLAYLNTFTSLCFLIICPRRCTREQEVHYFLLKGHLTLS